MAVRGVHPAPVSHAPIGARLRAARQRAGLTIDQLAQATELTKGFISRIERDLTSPSVATLASICQVLSLPIGALFDEPPVQLIRIADAPSLVLGAQGAVEHLVTPRGQRQVQVIHSELAAGATGGAKRYTVNCEVEVLHVITGQLVVELVDREIEMFESDTLTLPGSEPHTWRAVAPSRATWTLIAGSRSSVDVPGLLSD